MRDESGCLRLGKAKVTKRLFTRNGIGAEKYAKSKFMCDAIILHHMIFQHIVWQVLALVQKLLTEGKVATQREAYYCLVQHFKSQSEFNDTLQGT